MLVRCKKPYYDLEFKRKVEYGEIFEVSEERGEELTTVNNKTRYILCEKVAEPEKAPEPIKEGQEPDGETPEATKEGQEPDGETPESDGDGQESDGETPESDGEGQGSAEETEEKPKKKRGTKKAEE